MNWLNSTEWSEGLLRASWQAGLLVLVVLALRAVFKERLAPKWRHALWFLVVARLALPFTVEAPWSAFNLLNPAAKLPSKPLAAVSARIVPGLEIQEEAPATPQVRNDGASMPTHASFVSTAAELGISTRPSAPVIIASTLINWAQWLTRIWLAGVAALGLRLALAVVLFTRRMRQARPVTDTTALDLLSECACRAGVARAPLLLESDAVNTPAICGHWRPRLLVPPGMLASFTPDELRHVFFHELAHVKRRDVAVNWLTSLLQIVHWFNPLVWFAFARMRTDREIACDALAIELAGAGQSRSYGDTILKLLETMARPSLTPALVGILEDKDQLRVRISMIARFGGASRWSWLIAPLLLVLAFITLTDAQTTDAKKKLPPVVPLSITNILAEAENRDWLNDAVWQVAPRGTQDFGGIRFHLEGVVQLKGQGFGPKPYRERVTVPIPTNSAWGAIHVVGAMSFDAEPGTRVADLVWNYVDGSSRKVPILYAVQARDWWRLKYEKPDRVKDPLSKVVWNARHLDASKQGKTLRLYRMALPNPIPEKRAKSIEFVSANVRPSFIFNALTLDPLKAGERPDDSFDIEELDIEPKGRLQVRVLDAATSNALADAAIKISVREHGGSLLQASYDREFKTGPAGIVEIPVPEEGIDRLQLQAAATNYTGRLILWSKTNNEAIPASHTFYLKGSFAIGGTVVDSDGNPIAGARMAVMRTYASSADIPSNQTGERDEFRTIYATTGNDGAWVASGIGLSLKGSIMIEALHPEFRRTGVRLADGEAELRAKTHRLTMARGESITGRVVGPDDQPVAGATIKGTTTSSTETNQVTSDQNGRFRLGKVGTNFYERVVSVSAKGFAPLQQSLPPPESKDELVLKLKAGTKLGIRLQDPDAKPVAGARWTVNLPHEVDGGLGRWEAQGVSPEDGRFEFEAEDGVTYVLTVLARDWEAIRYKTIKSSAEEQIVTVRARRKLVGQALNAETGEAITSIKVRFGIFAPPSQLFGTGRADRPFIGSVGRFEVEFQEDNEDGIRVSAEDFEPKTLPVTAQDLAAQPFLVRLKPSPSLQGVARTKDGRVLPDATVAVSGPGTSLSVRGGIRIQNGLREGVVRTDAQGRFKLQVPENAGLVFASVEGLFGSASVDEVRASGEIVLRGNGKISGLITLNGRPLSGRKIEPRFMGERSNYYPDLTESDGNGRFHFDNVPFGKWSIIEMISVGRESFADGLSAFVEVVPGQTAEVVIAKAGAIVKGVLSPAPSDSVQDVIVGLTTGESPKFVSASPAPPTPQQIKEFEERGDVKKARAAIRQYSAKLTSGGSAFSFEGVPPGEYLLNVVVIDGPGHQMVSRKIVIPDATAGADAIDIGTVALESGSRRKTNP